MCKIGDNSKQAGKIIEKSKENNAVFKWNRRCWWVGYTRRLRTFVLMNGG